MVEKPKILVVDILEVGNSRVIVLVIEIRPGAWKDRRKRAIIIFATDRFHGKLVPLILGSVSWAATLVCTTDCSPQLPPIGTFGVGLAVLSSLPAIWAAIETAGRRNQRSRCRE